MRRVLVVLSVIAGIVSTAFVIAPLAAPYGSYLGLDGTPGFVDHSWGLTDVAYLLGDFLCHQMEDRSFIINGSQMPVCVRDFGLLTGFSIGAAVCSACLQVLRFKIIPIIAMAMVLVTVAEWAVEPAVGDYPVLRFATGIISGAGAALLTAWMLDLSVRRNEQADA